MRTNLFRLAIVALILSPACSDKSPSQPTGTMSSMSAESQQTARAVQPSRSTSSPRVVPPRTSISGVERPLETGSWGSPQSNGLDNYLLTVTSSGATLRSPCSTGTLDGVIQVDTSGRFENAGTYQVQAGPAGLANPARFVGTVAGQKMTITVVVPRTGQIFGPFTLSFGQVPRIGYCPIV